MGRAPAVPRALDVVLPAHGVHPGALAADVTGHERQVAQALHVVHAADVLGDAQGVVDGAALGLSVDEGGALDVGRRHLGDGLGPLGRELLDVVEEGFRLGGASLHEALVDQTLAVDDVGHGKQERDVRSHPEGQVDVGQLPRARCGAGPR